MNADISRCTLQSNSTIPTWSNVTLRDSPCEYMPRLNRLAGEIEKTLCLSGSLFGNCTVVPRCTASTCGTKFRFFWSNVTLRDSPCEYMPRLNRLAGEIEKTLC